MEVHPAGHEFTHTVIRVIDKRHNVLLGVTEYLVKWMKPAAYEATYTWVDPRSLQSSSACRAVKVTNPQQPISNTFRQP